MTQARSLSPQTRAVLEALANRAGQWSYGLELSRETGLKSGSLYPILIRLADRGLLQSKWLEAVGPGRPPRHAYRIARAGMMALVEPGGGHRSPLKEATT